MTAVHPAHPVAAAAPPSPAGGCAGCAWATRMPAAAPPMVSTASVVRMVFRIMLSQITVRVSRTDTIWCVQVARCVSPTRRIATECKRPCHDGREPPYVSPSWNRHRTSWWWTTIARSATCSPASWKRSTTCASPRCATRKEARRAFANGHYHLVVLDLMLPGEGGLDFARWLRTPVRRADRHADRDGRGDRPDHRPGTRRRRLRAQAVQSARAAGAHPRRAASRRRRRRSVAPTRRRATCASPAGRWSRHGGGCSTRRAPRWR